jgi:NAD(P)H dehydrogenase (quinone)
LGIIFVPIGYKNKKLMDNSEAHGGSPWGAGTLAGDGTRQPSELELDIANSQGFEFGTLISRFN